MNCLRARSSRASWRCMSSNAARELAELVVGVGRIGCEKSPRGDLARRALEPLDAQRQRARHEVAGEHRDQQRDRRRRRGSGGGSATTLSWTSASDVGEHRDAAHLARPSISGSATSAWRPEPRRLGRASPCRRVRERLAGRPTARRRSSTPPRVGVGEHEQRLRRSPLRDAEQRRPRRSRASAATRDLARRARACGASEPTQPAQRRRVALGVVRRGRRASGRVRRVLELRRRRRGRRSPIAPSTISAEDQRQPVAQRPQRRARGYSSSRKR